MDELCSHLSAAWKEVPILCIVSPLFPPALHSFFITPHAASQTGCRHGCTKHRFYRTLGLFLALTMSPALLLARLCLFRSVVMIMTTVGCQLIRSQLKQLHGVPFTGISKSVAPNHYITRNSMSFCSVRLVDVTYPNTLWDNIPPCNYHTDAMTSDC